MKHLFVVLLASCCCSIAKAQSTDSLFMEAAITKLQHARDYTLKVAHLMPDEKFSFKPSPEEMGFGEQLGYCAFCR